MITEVVAAFQYFDTVGWVTGKASNPACKKSKQSPKVVLETSGIFHNLGENRQVKQKLKGVAEVAVLIIVV